MAIPDAASAVLRRISAGHDVVVVREGEGSSDAIAAADPARVLDLPMADRAAVAVATGIAMAGREVVVEVADASRLPALIEALREAVASRAGLVLRAPFGVFGASGVLDLLASVDGLSVHAAALSASGPALDALLNAGTPAVLLESASAEVGVLREGAHVLIVAAASEAGPAMAAAAALQGEGIEATVLALGSLWPVPAAVSTRLRSVGRLVVVTPPGEAAWGRRVAAVGLDAAFLYLEAPLSVVEGRAGDIQQAARSAAQF